MHSSNLASSPLFQILCKGSSLALSIENSESPLNSRIIGIPSNPQQLCQLWYLSKTSDGYEITNAVSDLGLEEVAGEIHLVKDKRKKGYCYRLEETKIGKQVYYVLRNIFKTDYVAHLEGILKSKVYDQDSEIQLFRFTPCFQNDIINLTSMLVHPDINMVISVPQAKKKDIGAKLALQQPLGKFNQRWIFIQVFNNYIIKNFRTGLVLDMKSQGLGNAVVQSKRTNSLNEVWIIERVVGGQGLYEIRSLSMPQWFLGAEDGRVIVGKKGSRWRLEGFRP